MTAWEKIRRRRRLLGTGYGKGNHGGGLPKGYAFVMSQDSSGNFVRVTTTNENGKRVPVITRVSA